MPEHDITIHKSPSRAIVSAEPTQQARESVKDLCGDQACEELVIPSGDFSAEAEGMLAWCPSDEVETICRTEDRHPLVEPFRRVGVPG
jgi:hypothetical protein